MAVYVVLLIFSICLIYFSNKIRIPNNYFLFLFFLMITLILGFRGESVGEDTESYIKIANASLDLSWTDILSGFPRSTWTRISYGVFGEFNCKIETVYLLLVKLIMTVFHNAQCVLFVIALLTSFGMARFIKNNLNNRNDVYFAVYIYLCESMFMNSFNAMRQIFAMSIGLQTVAHLRKKEYRKAVIWILCASLIHQSAVIYLLLIPLYAIKDKRKGIKYIALITCAIYPLLSVAKLLVNRFLPIYAAYLNVNYWESSLGGILIIWIIIVLVIFHIMRQKNVIEEDYFLIYLLVIYLGIEVLGLQLTAISRIALYFRVFNILFFVNGKKYFAGKAKLIYLLMIIVPITILYLQYANSPARIYLPFWN